MKRLATQFPEGVEYDIPFDTTLVVDASIKSVYTTLIEAAVLVLVVILVFLQDWRAVLIPATTVPVTIIGAFAALYVLGFTVNALTLFGLVLAIGIVVDDAIVVVENVVHHIERGEPPKEATIRAMGEVIGPIMSITLVLMGRFLAGRFERRRFADEGPGRTAAATGADLGVAAARPTPFTERRRSLSPGHR